MSLVDLTIDGIAVRIPEGATLLDACTSAGIETPTLCFLESLTPVNACRVCVVELEGSRVLVPACARRAERGMAIHTDSARVRHSRKMVLEFLASTVDLSTATDAQRFCERYGTDPGRYGTVRATVEEPIKIDNALYVRDYAKCILCYSASKRAAPRRKTRSRSPSRGAASMRRSRLVRRRAARLCLRVLRKLHWRLSHRRAHVLIRIRSAPARRMERRRADQDRHDLLGLWRRLHVDASRPGERDREGHLTDRKWRHQRPPLHQRPLRL